MPLNLSPRVTGNVVSRNYGRSEWQRYAAARTGKGDVGERRAGSPYRLCACAGRLLASAVGVCRASIDFGEGERLARTTTGVGEPLETAVRRSLQRAVGGIGRRPFEAQLSPKGFIAAPPRLPRVTMRSGKDNAYRRLSRDSLKR